MTSGGLSDKKALTIFVCLLLICSLLTATVMSLVLIQNKKIVVVPSKYRNIWDSSLTFNDDDIQKINIKNDELKILQLTDIHYDFNNDKKEETLNLIDAVIGQSNADLIVVTGDWTSQLKGTYSHAKIVFDRINAFGIPWAPVFGNHDIEGELTRFDYADLFALYEFCVFKAGFSNIGGLGNYVLNTYKDNVYHSSVILMDSNTAIKLHSTKYKPMYQNQVEWYKWVLNGLNAKHSKGITSVNSLLFFHIPLPEYVSANIDGERLWGSNDEASFPPYKNVGLFDAIKEFESTKGVFVGHDHCNSAGIVYQGVLLSYGIQSGWCKGYAEEQTKGGSLIKFNKNGQINIDYLSYNL